MSTSGGPAYHPLESQPEAHDEIAGLQIETARLQTEPREEDAAAAADEQGRDGDSVEQTLLLDAPGAAETTEVGRGSVVEEDVERGGESEKGGSKTGHAWAQEVDAGGAGTEERGLVRSAGENTYLGNRCKSCLSWIVFSRDDDPESDKTLSRQGSLSKVLSALPQSSRKSSPSKNGDADDVKLTFVDPFKDLYKDFFGEHDKYADTDLVLCQASRPIVVADKVLKLACVVPMLIVTNILQGMLDAGITYMTWVAKGANESGELFGMVQALLSLASALVGLGFLPSLKHACENLQGLGMGNQNVSLRRRRNLDRLTLVCFSCIVVFIVASTYLFIISIMQYAANCRPEAQTEEQQHLAEQAQRCLDNSEASARDCNSTQCYYAAGNLTLNGVRFPADTDVDLKRIQSAKMALAVQALLRWIDLTIYGSLRACWILTLLVASVLVNDDLEELIHKVNDDITRKTRYCVSEENVPYHANKFLPSETTGSLIAKDERFLEKGQTIYVESIEEIESRKYGKSTRVHFKLESDHNIKGWVSATTRTERKPHHFVFERLYEENEDNYFENIRKLAVDKLAHNTMPKLSDGWEVGLATALVQLLIVLFSKFLLLLAEKDFVSISTTVLHGVLYSCFCTGSAILLLWPLATVSTECDRLMGAINTRRLRSLALKNCEKQLSKIDSLETGLRQLNSDQGVGFVIFGHVIHKRMLKNMGIVLCSVLPATISTMIALAPKGATTNIGSIAKSACSLTAEQQASISEVVVSMVNTYTNMTGDTRCWYNLSNGAM